VPPSVCITDYTFEPAAPIVGGTRALSIKLYTPSCTPPPAPGYPTVIFVHGGGWHMGSHATWVPFFTELLSRGLAVASVDYRLSQQQTFPAQIYDVKGAVRWLRQHAAGVVDPDRIGAWGLSAGAHLTALLATTGDLDASFNLEGAIGGSPTFSSAIKAAVLYYPITDLLNANPDFAPVVPMANYDLPDSLIGKLIGLPSNYGVGSLRTDCANMPPYPMACSLIVDANPITWVSSDDPLLFIRHSTNDPTAPLASSLKLIAAYEDLGVEGATLIEMPGDLHRPFGAPYDCESAEWLAQQL
jgi:acetyl esterase/lipase